MAEQKGAGPEKKGFFARRREDKAAATPAGKPAAPARTTAPPLKGTAPQARPAAAPAKPAPQPEVRVSLESLPEVEKRIDRMSATERRQKLLDRYEQKYGERLDLPKVFISIEDETKAEAASAADAMPAGRPVDEARMAAVTGMAPPRPAAPPPKAPAPARTGFFGARPAAPQAARPGAPAPARPAAPVAAGPAAPAAAPGPVQPGIPVQYTGKAFWKYLWNPARFPMRAIAKLKFPGNQSKLNMYTAADAGIWILLAIPRFLVLLWAGLIAAAVSKYVLKKKGPEAAEPVPAVN
jgi:hypothetical protein